MARMAYWHRHRHQQRLLKPRRKKIFRKFAQLTNGKQSTENNTNYFKIPFQFAFERAVCHLPDTIVVFTRTSGRRARVFAQSLFRVAEPIAFPPSFDGQYGNQMHFKSKSNFNERKMD